MAKFEPKVIFCTLKRDSYKYLCKTHTDENGNQVGERYQFSGNMTCLVKNKEDYDELIALNIFEDYNTPEEAPVSVKSETTKERKLRERAEAEADKESVEKAKSEDLKEENKNG